MMLRFWLSLAVSVLLVATVGPSAAGTNEPDDEPPIYDFGGYHREVTTTSEAAQLWFDRGLALSYAFNHEEAIRCFQRAVEEDPDCAMAHWGIAYASGPNINNVEMDEAGTKRAVDAAAAASSKKNVTDVERDLIAAIQTRYVLPLPENRTDLELAYSNAMRDVAIAHPDDPDVTAIFTESLMILRPWNHWNKEGVPAPETPEIVAQLEAGLEKWPAHPALCHFYIHTMEASPFPEKALAAADRLRNLMPSAGHVVHMPAHIDIALGHYENAIVANQKAIVEDTHYVELRGGMNFYTLYRVHNYHFLVYAAMFDGQKALALTASRDLVEQIPPELLAEWTDYLDAFVPTPLHVLVRFGEWEAILDEPRPSDDLPVTTSLWHYARGIAYANTGRVDEAEAEQRAFSRAEATVPETSLLFNNPSSEILGVAGAMLKGEVEYHRGNHEAAFEALREAVVLDDALHYDEPWGWMQPARHALGALLLAQDRAKEAEAVYVADLERHPNNVWALHGLRECAERRGDEEATAEFAARFETAAARTDVDVQASCYCRLGTE